MLRGAASGHLKTVPSAQLNFHRARVRRNHGRPPPNGFIERARRSLLPFTTPRNRTSDKVLALIRWDGEGRSPSGMRYAPNVRRARGTNKKETGNAED